MSQLSDAAAARNKANYEYLRWLMLLVIGAFSLTANLAFGKPFDGCQLLALKVALTANAIGILFGSIAVCGEAILARGILLVLCDIEEHKARGNHEAAANVRRAYQLPWPVKVCEFALYGSLIVCLIAWVAFIWLG